MTDQSQEPTMEEILASIRRIISEDEAPADTAGTPPAATAPAEDDAPVEAPTSFAPPAEPEPPASEDDVLELTDRYEAPNESIGDLDVMDPADAPFPAAPHPTPVEDTPQASNVGYDTLVGDSAAASAASAFAGLAASFKKPEASDETGIGGVTVEELARQLLRPMLKDWLDANLTGIVEAQVRKEVERIARSA
ncbi:DUF2497 domain-containing protein [Brevundimonas sp. PAMC22021]|uniref:DUF2497 domain-containing protein n=1 Tax=Brevundimonas sp. PAMC22021 TaxID=2861285 RepID=UPI001C62A88C|nr:DUF2497 domain-containing protein [Brevundimonas sp. PAMC22021]QYF88183.1 DUF2497 domain-containing protein [Brevundimonas sp. PAMC22021]